MELEEDQAEGWQERERGMNTGQRGWWGGRNNTMLEKRRQRKQVTQQCRTAQRPPVPSPDPVWSAEFPAKTSGHPTRGSQTALGTHCLQSRKPLREQRATRCTPAVSGPREGPGQV